MSELSLAVVNKNVYGTDQLRQTSDRLHQIFSGGESVEVEYLENGESLRFTFSEVDEQMAFIVTHRHDMRANNDYVAKNADEYKQVETIYVLKTGDNTSGLHCFEYDRNQERSIEDDMVKLYANREECGEMFTEFVEDCWNSLQQLQQRVESNVLSRDSSASCLETERLNRMLRPIAMRAAAVEKIQQSA